MRMVLFLGFFTMLLTPSSMARDIELISAQATVDHDEVFIGDKITYRISVEVPKEGDVLFPSFSADVEELVLRDTGGDVRGVFGTKRHEQWFVLDSYILGTHTIPPTVIQYRMHPDNEWQDYATNEVTIIVKSILVGEADANDIRDIKMPIDFPNTLQSLLIIVGILIVVILVAGVVRYYRKKHAGHGTIIIRPAHEIAYEALNILKEKDLVSKGFVKEFFSELSLIARHYIENRFNVRAPEMTTEEFLYALKDSTALTDEHKKSMKYFLFQCDMVKFAKYGPTPEEIETSFTVTQELIDQTREESASSI